MAVIYCFVEKQDAAFNEFIDKYDDNSEIHLYSSVIESCDGDLSRCMVEIFSLFLENEEKTWFVTDVKQLYTMVQEVSSVFFDQVIYLEQDVNVVSELPNKTWDLLEDELTVLNDQRIDQVFELFKTMLKVTDFTEFMDFSDFLRDELKASDWKKQAIYMHMCRSILYALEHKEIAGSEGFKIFLLSMKMKLEKDAESSNHFLRYILESDACREDHYYFIWNQYKDITFRRRAESNETTGQLLNKLYEESYRAYYNQVKETVCKIPLEERNKNRILIFTIQYLAEGHAPTNTVRERCKALKALGKEVFVVNTAEHCLTQGYVPFYSTAYGNVLLENYDKEEITIGSDNFWFGQVYMGDTIMERFHVLAALVKQIKPYYILSIGTGSMMADLCGHIVPCASMALVFSSLPKTMNPMKILGKKDLTEEEEAAEGIIASRFTFELKPQKKHFSREEFNLPADRFLVVIVGIRLDFDVTDDFLVVLEEICRQGCFVVFAGVYNNYAKMCDAHVTMQENSAFIGYCDDILALMEICDLYVNPRRSGGGFSIIEAFAKGVPGVYLPMGDVYTAGGEEFSVKNYDEMVQTIIKYKEDDVFYQEMSQKARNREKLMTSSVEAMRELHNEISSRVETMYW